MVQPDLLAAFARPVPASVEAAATNATEAIAAVHRRPVSLRRSEVTSSESVLRGAKLTPLIDTHAAATSFEQAVSVYALLAPEQLQSNARLFARAPLQILARMSAAAGGAGMPVDAAAAASAQALARLIAQGLVPTVPTAPTAPTLATASIPGPSAAATSPVFPLEDWFLPCLVHLVIEGRGIFGEHSGVIARASARLAAVHTGFDPRGLALFEPYLNRHRAEYAKHLRSAHLQDGGWPAVEFLLRAWSAGAKEAESIAAQL